MLINKWIKFRPFFEGEGLGGGGAAGAGGDAGVGGIATALTGGAAEGGDQGAAQNTDAQAAGQGDNTSGQTEGGQKEGNTGEAPAEFKLDVPEGFEQFSADFETFNGEAQDWMKANPKATAADAFKWAAERQAKLVKSQTESMSEQFQQTVQGWEAQAKADPEIGGDKFNENISIGRKAVEQFGGPKLMEALTQSGMGSHPEMIRFAVKVGQAMADPKILVNNSGGSKPSFVNGLYGNKS